MRMNRRWEEILVGCRSFVMIIRSIFLLVFPVRILGFGPLGVAATILCIYPIFLGLLQYCMLLVIEKSLQHNPIVHKPNLCEPSVEDVKLVDGENHEKEEVVVDEDEQLDHDNQIFNPDCNEKEYDEDDPSHPGVMSWDGVAKDVKLVDDEDDEKEEVVVDEDDQLDHDNQILNPHYNEKEHDEDDLRHPGAMNWAGSDTTSRRASFKCYICGWEYKMPLQCAHPIRIGCDNACVEEGIYHLYYDNKLPDFFLFCHCDLIESWRCSVETEDGYDLHELFFYH